MRRVLSFFLVSAIYLSANTSQVNEAKIWYSVGKDYMIKKKFKDAIRNFKKAISYDSTWVQVYLDLARAYLELGFFDSAEVAYRKVAEIDPKDSRGWQGLGFMYGIVKKDIVQGIKFYREALRVDPENNDARFGLAKLYASADSSSKADSLYKEALDKDPENPGIAKSYGVFLYEMKRYEEAIPYLEKVLPFFSEDKELKLSLIDCYRLVTPSKNEHLQKAIQLLSELLNQNPEEYSLYVKRAEIYEKMKNYRKALKDYDKAIEIRPDFAPTYLKKANLLIDKLNNLRSAKKVLEKALTLQYPSNELKAAAFVLMGDVFLEEAENLRKKADKLRKEGREKEAREEYGKSLSPYEKALSYYSDAVEVSGGKWAEYARKQIKRIEKLKLRAWRRSKGIE